MCVCVCVCLWACLSDRSVLDGAICSLRLSRCVACERCRIHDDEKHFATCMITIHSTGVNYCNRVIHRLMRSMCSSHVWDPKGTAAAVPLYARKMFQTLPSDGFHVEGLLGVNLPGESVCSHTCLNIWWKSSQVWKVRWCLILALFLLAGRVLLHWLQQELWWCGSLCKNVATSHLIY